MNDEVMELVQQQGKAIADFVKRHDEEMDRMASAYRDLAVKANRPALFGGSVDTNTKQLKTAIRALLRGDDREIKAMSVGSAPDGGFAVLPAFSDQLTRVEIDLSPMRQIARVVQIEQADAFEELIDKDVAAANWVSETGARPGTATPQLAKLRIPAHEIYAAPQATQTLIDDAKIDVTEWLSDKVGQQFATVEGTAFFTGDGVGKPRGVLDYPTAATADASRAWGTFEHVATGTSGGLGTDPNGANKLIDVMHKLKAGYRRDAVWVMNKKTAGEVRKLKDGSGRFVWVDSLAQGQPPSLLGYPVVEAEDMPDIAANSLSIAFGNFKRGYTIVDRIGMRLLVDPYSAKPYVIVYVYKRVGGDVNDFHAIKLLKFATA